MIVYKTSGATRSNGLAIRSCTLRSDRENKEWNVFVAVPQDAAELLTDRADVFVPLVLMFGLSRSEGIDLGGIEVDEVLLRNVSSAIRHFGSWYPNLKFVAPTNFKLSSESLDRRQKAAVFYSGGVDGSFSMVRHTQGRYRVPGSVLDRNVDFAYHIFHTDKLTEQSAAASARDLRVLAENAERLGVHFVPVISNVMLFDSGWQDEWGPLTHGAALATILHATAAAIGYGIIGSSHSYGHVKPWGSSPITDPLFSGRALQVIHDGSTYTRVEKTEQIARVPEALAALNVCDKLVPGQGYANCSKCQKCLRTMVTLDLFGKASNTQSSSFVWDSYTSAEYGRMFLRNESDRSFADEIVDAASTRRPDIREAAERALKNSNGFHLRALANVEKVVKSSVLGREYRTVLRQPRAYIYKRLGVWR